MIGVVYNSTNYLKLSHCDLIIAFDKQRITQSEEQALERVLWQ